MSQDSFRNPPIDVTPPAPPPRPAEPVREPQMANSALQRFLGGAPVAVFLRLLFVSLVVGALLVWLDIKPFQIFNALQRFVNRLWMMGWDAVRARYTAGEVGGKKVPGYLDEKGVPEGSTTETYVAMRADIDSWRWAGVPILLRHGKRMPQKFTEVRVQFRVPPMQLFNRPEGLSEDEFREKLRDGSLCQIRPNVLTLQIQPREAIRLSFGVKTPGSVMVMAPAELSFDYREHFGVSTAPAYERLLQDALQGDATLFVHADEIEASWEFVDAFRSAWDSPDAPPLAEYEAGTWGPDAADELFRGCEGGWSQGQV